MTVGHRSVIERAVGAPPAEPFTPGTVPAERRIRGGRVRVSSLRGEDTGVRARPEVDGLTQVTGYRIRKSIGRTVSSSLLGALLVAAAVVAPGHRAAAEPGPSSLTVTASGRIEARPDIAVVTAGVVTEAKTSAEALANADKAAAAFLAEVEAAGIAKADVATTEFRLNPIWSSRPSTSTAEASRITGYGVTNVFAVKVRRLADLGPLLERLVAKGSNSISGIAFEVSDADARRDQARVAAVAAARARAELLAHAAGQRLERLITLTEGAADAPHPVYFAKAAPMAAGVPVEAGTQIIGAEVTMTFEIAPERK